MIYKNAQPLIVFCLIMMAFMFGSSCGLLGGKDEKKPSGDLMPLEVGNYWVYETTYLDVMKDTIRYEVTAEVEVPVGDTTYTAYAANFLPFPPDLEPYFWLRRNGEEGIYSMGGISNADTLFINELEYKLPSEVGESIQAPQVSFSYERFEFYLSDTLHITLIDDDREVVTPAGKFSCLVYKFDLNIGDDLDRVNYYMFYSINVGLVKQEERAKFENRLMTEQILIEYRTQ